MAAASPSPRWTRLEHDERRAQILGCARRLFSAESYSAVSTTRIAEEAGVARGLIHHYFGTKRDLYVEVVRTMVRLPPPPVPEGDLSLRRLGDIVSESIDGWLEMVQRNRGTWFAALGLEELGGDAEIAAILEAAREEIVDRLVTLARVHDAEGTAAVEPLLRAALRSSMALAEESTREWLLRDRLTRAQAHILITRTMTLVVRDVVPRLAAVTPSIPTTTTTPGGP